MHDIIKEILKQQKRAEKKADKRKKEEEWRFYITPPKPAKWRARVIPLVKLPEALGIVFKRPEFWDLCRDLDNPLKCYRTLREKTKEDEVFQLVLEALMSGGDVRTVLAYVERGDVKGLKEYIYTRFRP